MADIPLVPFIPDSSLHDLLTARFYMSRIEAFALTMCMFDHYINIKNTSLFLSLCPLVPFLIQVGANLVQHSKITMTFNRQQRSTGEAAIEFTVLLLLNFCFTSIINLEFNGNPTLHIFYNKFNKSKLLWPTDRKPWKALGQVNERIITVREKNGTLKYGFVIIVIKIVGYNDPEALGPLKRARKTDLCLTVYKACLRLWKYPWRLGRASDCRFSRYLNFLL